MEELSQKEKKRGKKGLLGRALILTSFIHAFTIDKALIQLLFPLCVSLKIPSDQSLRRDLERKDKPIYPRLTPNELERFR